MLFTFKNISFAIEWYLVITKSYFIMLFVVSYRVSNILRTVYMLNRARARDKKLEASSTSSHSLASTINFASSSLY